MIYARLDDMTLVARSQITPSDVANVAAAGVKMIVNNRPDGEELGQPAGGEIEAAAKAAGLSYRHIPVTGSFTQAQADEMASALNDGPALLFCRSGTRSTYLWALARARHGEKPETIVRAAHQAGYDLSTILPYLQAR